MNPTFQTCLTKAAMKLAKIDILFVPTGNIHSGSVSRCWPLLHKHTQTHTITLKRGIDVIPEMNYERAEDGIDTGQYFTGEQGEVQAEDGDRDEKEREAEARR